MGIHVKKNGVDVSLGSIAVLAGHKSYNVASTAWVANADPDTSTDYPYIAVIQTTDYTDDSRPIWQMSGVGNIPTATERDEINKILEAYFDHTGITLYATDQPAENLVLNVAGSANLMDNAAASTVVYNSTASGLGADNVQSAIDAVNTKFGTVLTDTITTGNTSVTFTDTSITADSFIDVYFKDAIIAPTAVTVTTGQCIVEIDALEADQDVAIRVLNLL